MVKAIVLAAGNGSRMKSSIKKQFMEINGLPLIVHTISQFEKSDVEEIILVTGKDEIDYCKELVRLHAFSKVKDVISGGLERYESVYKGLEYLSSNSCKSDIVMIHDGARPLVSVKLINKCIETMKDKKAIIVGVPVKDTIKIVDDANDVSATPDRSRLWSIQTPQVFTYGLIKECYDKMQKDIESGVVKPTDDSMVVEQYSDEKVRVIEGEYVNIKVTTPDDIELAAKYMNVK